MQSLAPGLKASSPRPGLGFLGRGGFGAGGVGSVLGVGAGAWVPGSPSAFSSCDLDVVSLNGDIGVSSIVLGGCPCGLPPRLPAPESGHHSSSAGGGGSHLTNSEVSCALLTGTKSSPTSSPSFMNVQT